MDKERKKPLVWRSIRLTKDQITFLKGIKDASALIRRALDKEILIYSTKENPVLTLNRQVVELQSRIERIKESREYKETMEKWNSMEMVKFRGLTNFEKDFKPEMAKEYEYLKKAKESYEKEIEILEKEIKETKNKIITA